MAKLFDGISLTIITFLITFVWTSLAFDSALPALIMSCTLTLIAAVTFAYARKKTAKPYSYDRLALEFGIRGNEYIISLLKGVLKDPYVVSGGNYILLERSVVIANFRFSPLGIGDIGAACTLARKYGLRQIFIVCRTVDRHAYTVAQLEGVRLCPVRVKAVYKLLKRHGALPDLKPVKEKITLKSILSAALSRQCFRSYAFSGVLLVLISFITPLRIYYIVMGSISLLLAALTLTPLGNGSFSSPKMADEFERAIQNMPRQLSIDDIDDLYSA